MNSFGKATGVYTHAFACSHSPPQIIDKRGLADARFARDENCLAAPCDNVAPAAIEHAPLDFAIVDPLGANWASMSRIVPLGSDSIHPDGRRKTFQLELAV